MSESAKITDHDKDMVIAGLKADNATVRAEVERLQAERDHALAMYNKLLDDLTTVRKYEPVTVILEQKAGTE